MQEMVVPGVVLKHLDGFRVACVPHHGPYAEIGVAFQRLLHMLRERRLRPDGPMIALYHEEPTHESAEARSEAAVPVLGDLRPDGEIRARELPPCTVASLIHDGPPSRVQESYRLLDEWIKTNGYERAGPVREVYARDLSEIPPGILYAEIQIPVRRKGRKG